MSLWLLYLGSLFPFVLGVNECGDVLDIYFPGFHLNDGGWNMEGWKG